MNGTVTPSVVVVGDLLSADGGLLGSYGWNGPPELFEFVPGNVAPSLARPSAGTGI